jgi:divalent metal cation (Fe/Co/Zn/Cd) transporter
MIIAAAMAIGFTAVVHFQHPCFTAGHGVGVAISLVAAAINFAVARVLLREGRSRDSIVLEADGHHLMSDVWTSVGVAIGLVLAWATHWAWLDPLMAIHCGA